jgi:hypothetical protein
MNEKPPRRAPSPTGSEQTGDETLAENGRGRTVSVDKPRPDGKVELTEQAAYEVLGFCFPSWKKSVGSSRRSLEVAAASELTARAMPQVAHPVGHLRRAGKSLASLQTEVCCS